jgi:ubiquinone/menaquinone biosynthesis C-methylase UbiE
MNQEQVWDEIAKVWKGYRCRPLAEVSDFLAGKQGRILDLCCGSGRNFIKIKGHFYGVDFSEEMLKFAKERANKMGVEAFISKTEADKLPFPDNFFDAAVFIDALHCIESQEGREKSLHELFRVLKTGAEAIISVWDKEKEQFKDKEKEIQVPWKVNDKVCNRYYYLYDKKEILDLLKLVGFQIKEVSEKQVEDEAEGEKKGHLGESIVLIVRKPDPLEDVPSFEYKTSSRDRR